MNMMGVYKITNIQNGKFYIGSAVNFERRAYMHRNRLSAGQHRNAHLQNAWNKYGSAAFRFELVETVEDKSQLTAIEQKWIDNLNASNDGYNICKVATSRLGVKARPETVEKQRLAATGVRHHEQAKRKMSAAKRGVPKPPRSAEHRERLGLAHKGKLVTEETRQRLREAWVKRKEKIEIVRTPADFKENT